MLAYYFGLALRSLRRNAVLTALMIAAVGVGIGASMTTLTVFRAMSADPIRDKSRSLYAVQIDNWGPALKGVGTGDADGLQEQLSYQDVTNFMTAHAATRQAAMYRSGAALTPDNPQLRPFQVSLRATYGDFFAMFEVPFLYGGFWSKDDDQNHANVIVISRELNDKVFAGGNSVGRVLDLDGKKYRVVGVTDHWDPLPKFYDLNNNKYGKGEEAYLPFTRAIEDELNSWGNYNCNGDIGAPGWAGRLRSECVWFQFWAELPTAADAKRYENFLVNYAADQQRSGRFNWPPHVRLRDVREWLAYRHAVTDETRILVLVSFSFLLVCLINAMGLMLAKVMGRAADIGVRRALGANRRAIFGQCLIEAAVVGLAGGLLGLLLTGLGLLALRNLLSADVGRLTHFSVIDMGMAIGLAVIATTLAGLYPTWRAASVQPAWQLKVQ